MIMKTIKLMSFIVFSFIILVPFNKVDAQITVGGQIDVRINFPEIVINNPTPRKSPAPRKKRPVVVRERIPEVIVIDREPRRAPSRSLGTIMNQNSGPRFDYHVINANVREFRNNELDLVLNFNTGDVMVITMVELNRNDYNFHYSHKPNRHNNSILNITLNNMPIDLNNASVSLQPSGHNGFTAVLNLHSLYHGDYNRTVNAIY